MKLINKTNSNYIFNLFLLFYLIFGLFLSVNTGITADEFIEQKNWIINLEVIKSFFDNDINGYFNLLELEQYLERGFTVIDYESRFYGIGFHYLSQIYLLLAGVIVKLDQFSEETSKVLLNHSFIFFTYFLSGIFAKKILNLLIKDEFYSNIFLIFYLFYPYLLGHGFYNPKDIPFLFAWIISTYISIRIFLQVHRKKNITLLNIFLLSLSTSFLFSIRIAGILILLQYLITLIITSGSLKESFYTILKLYFYKIVLFFLTTFLLTILFYPIFWNNPLLIFDSINQMRNYPQGACTLTLGKCMEAMNLPSSYIFIWLFFKLPLLSFVGLMLFPFIEKKIFSQPINQIILGSILLTIISIIFLLIFLETNLYDELRQLLFLFPLIIIVSFSTIYFFSKKLILYISIISIFFFTIQNINMYPYQYTWFNLFGNFTNINNNFELDYYGVSGRNIARKINNNNQLLYYKDKCIYVAPTHLIKPFISTEYRCIKHLTSIYPKSTEKYILIKYTREIRRENPSSCKLVFEETYNLNLFKNRLKMGEVFICN